MCRRWNTSWPSVPARALLALALLLGPLGASLAMGRLAPAATITVCAAGGGAKQIPDPLAPAAPVHVHCDACPLAPPALPVPAAGLRPPRSGRLAWAVAAARHATPLALPPEQARAPPDA